MDSTAEALSRLRRFAGPVNSELPPVDVALGQVRRLLEDAGVVFRIVGGVAVVHHGYLRTTEDVDVLVAADAGPRIDAQLVKHGTLGASARDPQVVDLRGLVELKLVARRHRDLADVVELLKRLDEAQYTEVEAAVERSLRPELARLRRDALEELGAEE